MLEALGVILGSIIFGAVGDGLDDRGKKPVGHAFKAAEVALLLASPWILPLNQMSMGEVIDYGMVYAGSYWLLRMGLFDVIRNIAKGDSPSYIGSSSLWGKFLRKLNAPTWGYWIGRGIFTIVGTSLPIKYL
jgi:hypothetical protein